MKIFLDFLDRSSLMTYLDIELWSNKSNLIIERFFFGHEIQLCLSLIAEWCIKCLEQNPLNFYLRNINILWSYILNCIFQ